jgi:hypothetical protein
MLRQKILPGLLITLSAAIWFSGQASSGEPTADQCRTKPGLSAPQGTHWYYRVNRADNRHCWYLAAVGAQTPSHTRAAMSPVAPQVPTPPLNDTADTAGAAPSQAALPQTGDAQAPAAWMTSAAATFRAQPVDGHAPTIDFAARWPDLPRPLDLASYADQHAEPDTAKQMPAALSVVEVEPQQDAAGAAFGSLSFASALVMASLLLAAGIFKSARQLPYLRDDQPAAVGWPSPHRHDRPASAATACLGGTAGTRHEDPVWRAPTPTDPAQDLKTSLSELMCDLRRASATSDAHRSFAPRSANRKATNREYA